MKLRAAITDIYAQVRAPQWAAPNLDGQSVDQLISYLSELKSRKAELEKRQAAAEKVLREKLQEQTERIKKLGISLEDAPRADASLPAPLAR